MRHPPFSGTTLLTHSRPPPRFLGSPSPLLSTKGPTTPPHPYPSLSQNRPLISPSTLLNNLTATTPTPLRTLSHTTCLPHPASLVFTAISDISAYPTFLPLLLSSRVLRTHPSTQLPTRAVLRVGYGPFGIEEDWTSDVFCDPGNGTVEARSTEGNGNGTVAAEGMFEVLKTRWEIMPPPGDTGTAGEGRSQHTSVKLDVEVKFRSVFYDQIFAQVEGKVAQVMIGAFEKRAKDLELQQQKQT